MFMKRLLAILVLGSFMSCSPSTQIEKSWRDPAETLSQSAPNTILAIALVKDETSRRVVEDNMVKHLNNKARTSYNLIPQETLKAANEADLVKILTDGGYTHVVMMRLADVEKETSYVPGTTTGFYGGYGRYYGYGAGMYSSPGYYTTDKNYFVETAVYSVNPNKLMWTGTTKTVNPTKMYKAVDDIAAVVIEKMKKEGFLVK